MNAKAKKDIARLTTDRMIAALQEDRIPWQRTWASRDMIPKSLSTRKPYRGINPFILALTAQAVGYGSPWWGTYKQIAERGGQVRKDEKSTPVVFWKILRMTEVVDGQEKTKSIPLLRSYNVFNADQADWPEGSKAPKVEEIEAPGDPVEAAVALVAEYLATGPKLTHGGNSACYVPALDAVHMPHFEQFTSAEEYHSTLFHELTHSTGHTSRLARKGIAEGTFGKFGSEVYSQEELVAEMGAAMLCALAGIEQASVFGNSASYIQHWIKVLKGDDKLVITAAAQAQKAVDLISGETATKDNGEEAEAA